MCTERCSMCTERCHLQPQVRSKCTEIQLLPCLTPAGTKPAQRCSMCIDVQHAPTDSTPTITTCTELQPAAAGRVCRRLSAPTGACALSCSLQLQSRPAQSCSMWIELPPVVAGTTCTDSGAHAENCRNNVHSVRACAQSVAACAQSVATCSHRYEVNAQKYSCYLA